jgi:hypothetical protein
VRHAAGLVQAAAAAFSAASEADAAASAREAALAAGRIPKRVGSAGAAAAHVVRLPAAQLTDADRASMRRAPAERR